MDVTRRRGPLIGGDRAEVRFVEADLSSLSLTLVWLWIGSRNAIWRYTVLISVWSHGDIC